MRQSSGAFESLRRVAVSRQVLYSEVSESNGFIVVVILQADVAGRTALVFIGPGVDDFAVEANGVVVAGANDLKLIPLAWLFHIHECRSMERIDRTGPPRWLVGFFVSDFDFVALFDSDPRVFSWIWEPQENPGLRSW